MPLRHDIGAVDNLDSKLRDINLVATCSGVASVLACLLALWVIFSYTEPNFNSIGLMMAILQTFLSVVAVGGFFLIRNLAANKAVETAENELKKYFADNGSGVALIRRYVEEWQDRNPTADGADHETNQIMEGLDG